MSPLHYRHGCVIVRGGKVIGQGYNDHRPHFDGGAKRLASSSAYNSSAIAAVKQKNKHSNRILNRKGRSSEQNEKQSEIYSFDGDLNGCSTANTPLSMHSEMMAIHSALSLSNTLAPRTSTRLTQWLQKPSFKLPGRGKRELHLQTLEAYVNQAISEGAVTYKKECGGKQHGGASQVQGSQFETSSSQRGEGGDGGEGGELQQEVRVQRLEEGENAAVSEEQASEEQYGERTRRRYVLASSKPCKSSSGST